MIRNTGILLVLLTQFVSAVSRGGLVLCVHESGETEIEWTWSLCCRTNGAHACDSGTMPTVGTDGQLALAGDPCSDLPLPSSDALVAPAHAGQQRSVALAYCDVPSCLSRLNPASTEIADGVPHAPADVMASATARAIRTVVLRL